MIGVPLSVLAAYGFFLLFEQPFLTALRLSSRAAQSASPAAREVTKF